MPDEDSILEAARQGDERAFARLEKDLRTSLGK